MSSRLVKFILYPLLGLVSVVLFVLLTLPTAKIQLLTEAYLAKFLGDKYHVSSAEFDVSLLDGVTMDTILLEPYFLNEDGTRPTDATIDKLAFDASVLDYLLSDELNATFEGELASGTFSGTFALTAEAATASVELDSIVLQRAALFKHMVDFPVGGIASGNIDLDFDPKFDIQKGDIGLTLRSATLGPALIDPKTGFSLEKTRAGTLTVAVDVSPSKRYTIRKGTGEGEDVDVQLSGFYQAKTPRSPRSQMNITLRLRFSDQYLQENQLDSLLRSTCKVYPDGFIVFTIRGFEGQLKKGCDPPGPGGARPGSTARAIPTSTRTPTPPPPPDPQVITADPNPPRDLPVHEEDPPPPPSRLPAVRPASVKAMPSGVKPVSPQRSRQIIERAYPPPRK